MTPSERTSMYTTYLRDEGFSPTVNRHDDIEFRFEGMTYIIEVDERDEEYFRVFVPNILGIEDEDDRALARAAADNANTTTKAIKIILVGDYVWASLETFLASPDAFKPVFRRYLRALQVGMHHFATHLREHARRAAQTAGGESATAAGVLSA